MLRGFRECIWEKGKNSLEKSQGPFVWSNEGMVMVPVGFISCVPRVP